MPIDIDKLKRGAAGGPPPFRVRKIGHVVLRVRDLQKSVDFYTGVLGFKVSDVYPEDMMPGGMVFMRSPRRTRATTTAWPSSAA